MEIIEIKTMEEERMENKYGTVDLKEAPKGGSNQMAEMEGVRVPIEILEVIDGKTGFDEKGKPMPAGETRMVKKLRVQTKVVGQLKGSKGDNAGKTWDIRASEVFGLTFRGNEWMVPTIETSNVQKFMRKYGARNVNELIGVNVMTVLRKSPDGQKEFLGILY